MAETYFTLFGALCVWLAFIFATAEFWEWVKRRIAKRHKSSHYLNIGDTICVRGERLLIFGKTVAGDSVEYHAAKVTEVAHG